MLMSGIHGNRVTLLCYEMCRRVQPFRRDMISGADETLQRRQERMLKATNKRNLWNGDKYHSGRWVQAEHPSLRETAIWKLFKNYIVGKDYPNSVLDI